MASNVGFLNEIVFNHTKRVIDTQVAAKVIPEYAAPDEQDLLFNRAMKVALRLLEDGCDIDEIAQALRNRFPTHVDNMEIITIIEAPEFDPIPF